MQPIKITIEGDYFDCQIYRGRLYLWTFDGILKICDWNKLVKSFIRKETDYIAFNYSFMSGSDLYNDKLIELFIDKDFKRLLLNRFESIRNRELYISNEELDKFLLGQQDTPTGLIPTDTEIYNNLLYFINEKGLFSTRTHKNIRDKYKVSTRPKKMWDCLLLSLKANHRYPQLALSAGEDGLYELHTNDNNYNYYLKTLKVVEKNANIFQISDLHSSFANYSTLSIYNTSIVNKSFMALFKLYEVKEDYYTHRKRNFAKTINEYEIFSNNSDADYISWGIGDKIYRATDNGFEIIKFNNYAKTDEGEKLFEKLQSINLNSWKGKVINGGTTYFGNIVECENALVVVQSDQEDYTTIRGPITRWRVYPRSINYENHLHVILEDRIEIYSFNHDYFINQKEKRIGLQFKM